MVVILFIVVVVIIMIVLAIQSESTKNEEAKRKNTLRKEANRIAQLQSDAEEKEREKIYGKLTKRIDKSLYLIRTMEAVLIYQETKTILIKNIPYKFSDILGYRVSDNSTTIHEAQTAQTKTSGASMLGRAVVGGVLLGGVGAVVGGATAKKNTVTDKHTVQTQHDYSITIFLNDLSNPTIIIKYGVSEKAVNELSAVLEIIIHSEK